MTTAEMLADSLRAILSHNDGLRRVAECSERADREKVWDMVNPTVGELRRAFEALAIFDAEEQQP